MEPGSTEAVWRRLETLLAPLHASALATARRLSRSRGDGDDLYQEAVLRAFEKLHTLRDESRFRSWFYATLLNRHRSRSRRAFWKRQVPLEDIAPEQEPLGEDGREWAGRIQSAHRASEALLALDAPQREVIVLFEIDGYAIDEIAEMQRVSISAVKSRLSRGRRKLRRFYERRGWGTGADASRDASPLDPGRLETARGQGDRRSAAFPRRLATAPAVAPEKERSHE
jgi:RNA polymerase sigma-70 factor (ECF subfamily)